MTYRRNRPKTAAQLRRNPPPGAKGYKPPRRKPVDYEGQEQAVLIRWLYGERQRGSAVGELYDDIYHVPNGGARHKKTAADMKRQGARSGVSDLTIRNARGGWHGLYLEFKATPPKHAALATSQREWLEDSEQHGYCAALARGLEEAKAVLREYASWPPTETQGPPIAMENGTEWRPAE